MDTNWSQYQEYIALSRYARWLPNRKRRETWEETVDRYIDFMQTKYPEQLTEEIASELAEAIQGLKVMPSMRCLMTAGKALERDNVAGYNCAYLIVDNLRAFDEALYILLCGTGVGFSVERQYVAQLPVIAEEFFPTGTVISVRDSKLGWAGAFKELIYLLASGAVPKWDMSKIRPAGARLKTFGGRASGPEPLAELFQYTVNLFTGAAGRRLSSLECHDLLCMIAKIVVVGGVRRAACISLSNLSDDRMRSAKYGDWYTQYNHRVLSNNSVAYTEKPEFEIFLKEMFTLYRSKSGERGIFNRVAATKQAARNGRRDTTHEFGCNPCSEIILRPFQFCNLTEVVVRPNDSLEILKQKVKYATILGTLQATLTDFRYLRKIWKDNTEEERLLGVSLTGIMDHPVLSGKYGGWGILGFNPNAIGLKGSEDELEQTLVLLKQVAIDTNKEWAEKLGIKQAAAITCVKPSGTVSQLVNSASGIHPRYSKYYIRRVMSDKKDPIAQLMIAQGVPYHVSDYAYHFQFPVRSPDTSVSGEDISAMSQLSLWKIYQDYWCEHKPSQSIYYTDEEFLDIFSWVYKNFDAISGISFFPKSDHMYGPTIPYEPIDKATYDKLAASMPKIDWSKLTEYEKDDMTEGMQEYACSSATGCSL